MIQLVLQHYKSALKLWLPMLSVHLFVRLITVAVILPFAGFLLTLALSFSDQSALTDQDIARFLLSPIGAIGALCVVSLLIVAAVVDLATMTAVLRSGNVRPMRALATSIAFIAGSVSWLFSFAIRFLLRVLAIGLPFLIPPALLAVFLLRDYDINFYLATHPPEFLWTIAVAGLCGAVMALVLLGKLTGWSIALHTGLFEKQTASESFTLSSHRMSGHRLALAKQLIAWFGVRVVLVAALTATTGFLLAEVPVFLGETPKAFFAVTTVIVLAWAAVNAFVTAVSNGALAVLLNEVFASRSDMPDNAPIPVETAGRSGVLPLVALGAISAVSVLVSGFVSNQFGGVGEVEIIGHRGAAASRPENTMAAVVKAVEDQADWVEIDVQETADGEVIVVHDSDFMKAAGVPTKVWDVTMEDVAQIDIGSWFDPSYADERAPLLADVLEAVKGQSKLIIELKYYGHDVDLENRVIDLVEAAGMQDQIATMSLKYPAVQKMIELRPEWRSGVLAATSVGDLAGLDGDFLAVSGASVSIRLLAQAEEADKDVYVWTINDAPSMSRMISMGVGGIITDDPALAREVMDHYKTLTTPERLMLRLADTIGFAFDLTTEPDVEP